MSTFQTCPNTLNLPCALDRLQDPPPQFAHDAIVVCIGGRGEPRNRTLRTPYHPTTCPATDGTAVSAQHNCKYRWRFALAVELEL